MLDLSSLIQGLENLQVSQAINIGFAQPSRYSLVVSTFLNVLFKGG